ncbi:T-complex protein 1 subunit delta [Gracilariopsis chorda]|uniref:T-complex protein 1 subunit delta n=1 Tax=Gracilariopsis chorda TaxID=448386 RepID=A0A2V3IHY0_9FLOR|nr:T-complex protein 1 subunit delta [Gracilariopsis chorda]|eukprot:PXF40750.1 T-complex protein 1 subunit delta [Gracilariopsis chorda]
MVAVQAASSAAMPYATPNEATTASAMSEKAKDVRRSNITAAKAVADAIRTSLGPRGMDKMVRQEDGSVLITNDGATILEQMKVEHPAAKMLVQLSRAQDVVAGDGTTSVVVICGALLSAALDLLGDGIHPSAISDAFQVALDKSLQIVKDMAVPVNLDDREALIQAAKTSLSSKVVSQYSNLLAPIAVDAVLTVKSAPQFNGNPNANGNSSTESSMPGVSATSATSFVDLKNIRTVKKLGGTIDDTELVDGLILHQHTAKAGSNAITRVQNAKVALIQFCISPPKTDVDTSVVVQDYTAMDRILREERQYILGLCKKIKATGCNVLLIQKSILRDAYTDLSLHFLGKMKIMVVPEVERDEAEFLSKSLGCLPIAGIESFTSDKLGKVELVEQVSLGPEKIVRMTGITKPTKETVSILVRGSNHLVLDEAERSLHDALCVVRSIVHKQYLIPGGGAPETEVSVMLSKVAKSTTGMEAYCIEAYAEALNVVPFTLAENAGLQPVEIVTDLRRRHAAGESGAGINVSKGAVTNIKDEDVVMPLLVFSSALSLATECVRQLLKIDDIVLVR